MFLPYLKLIIYGMMISALLAFILNGCINGASSELPQHRNVTVTLSPQIQPTIPLNQGAFFNSSSLNILASGLACPLDPYVHDNGLDYAGGNIVLTNPSTSFDDGAIANVVDSLEKNNPSLLPNGFAVVLAGFVGPMERDEHYGCSEYLEITNISQDFIQLMQITLRYTADPRPNLQHYNLIEICSLPHIQLPYGFCHGGRGSTDRTLTYYFQLTNGKSGTIISSSQKNAIPLQPGETVKIKLSLGPVDLSNADYIYSFVPQLTLSTLSQRQELNQLTSSAVFISKDLVSCYRVQHDDTFLKMDSLTAGGNPDGEKGSDGDLIFPECI